MPWTDDTRCLYCDGKLPLYRKLTQGQFCSKKHQTLYWEEQERLAVERLHQTHNELQAYRPPEPIESILGPDIEPLPVYTSAYDDAPRLRGALPQPHVAPCEAAVALVAADPFEYEMGVEPHSVPGGAWSTGRERPGRVLPPAGPAKFVARLAARDMAFGPSRVPSEPAQMEIAAVSSCGFTVEPTRILALAGPVGLPLLDFNASLERLSFVLEPLLPHVAPWRRISARLQPRHQALEDVLLDQVPLWEKLAALRGEIAATGGDYVPMRRAKARRLSWRSEAVLPASSGLQGMLGSFRPASGALQSLSVGSSAHDWRCAAREDFRGGTALLGSSCEPEMRFRGGLRGFGGTWTPQTAWLSAIPLPACHPALAHVPRGNGEPLRVQSWAVIPANSGLRIVQEIWIPAAAGPLAVSFRSVAPVIEPRRIPQQPTATRGIVSLPDASGFRGISADLTLAMASLRALPVPVLAGQTSGRAADRLRDTEQSFRGWTAALALERSVSVRSASVRSASVLGIRWNPAPAGMWHDPPMARPVAFPSLDVAPRSGAGLAGSTEMACPTEMAGPMEIAALTGVPPSGPSAPQLAVSLPHRVIRHRATKLVALRYRASMTPQGASIRPRLAGPLLSEPLSQDPLIPVHRPEPLRDATMSAAMAAASRASLPWVKLQAMAGHGIDFWRNAPRDLKLLSLAIPALLALVFSPALPKVRVAMPQLSGSFPVQIRQVVNQQVKGFRQSMADRAGIALNEDFRRGLDSWISKGGATTQWSFDATGFVQPGPLALYGPSMNLTDYQMEFMGIVERQAMSWVVRAKDFQNYYVVKLVVAKPGPIPTLRLTRYAVIDGKARDRVDTRVPIDARTDTNYRVRMDINGDNFSVSIQEQMIDHWNEPRLERGGIGFYTSSGEKSRIRWVQLTHQNDMLGRLCAYLAPVDFPTTTGSW